MTDTKESKQEHTPGPWLALPLPNQTGISIISKPRYRAGTACVVSRLENSNRNVGVDSEDAANAILIATAPELLETLEAAIACGIVPTSSASNGGASLHSEQVRVADQIRAAIAKARGE